MPDDFRAGFGQYYSTKDSMLAALLELCSIQHPKTAAGQDITCHNTFTPDFLRGMRDEDGKPRYAGKGWTIDQCAADAHSRNITGIVIYHFEKSDEQQEICAGWESMLDDLAKVKKENKARGMHEDTTVPMDTLPISHTQIGRLFCALNNARDKMFDRMHRTRPMVAILEYNSQSTGDRSSRVTGSGTIRSLKL